MNPHQRIVINGEVIQPGEVDTILKFQTLTSGIDLHEKKILDCGCNLGMMCYLATEEGAITKGIDINRDYISQARQLFPNLSFQTSDAEDISGSYDIILACSMLHYLGNLDKFLSLAARCSKLVLCDPWLDDSPDPIFSLSHRNIFIPSKSAFLNIAHKYFNKVDLIRPAISPDQSKRYIFHLSDPIPVIPQAILIYGNGNTGKTTLAHQFIGYKVYPTDSLFNTWKVAHMPVMFSVSFFADLARGNKIGEYLDFFTGMLERWIEGYRNRDIVIEGYELMFPDFKQRVVDLLRDWHITEINTDSNGFLQ